MKEVILGRKGPLRKLRAALRSIKENDAKLKESWRLTQGMISDCNAILDSYGQITRNTGEEEQFYPVMVKPPLFLPFGEEDTETTEYKTTLGTPELPKKVTLSRDAGWTSVNIKVVQGDRTEVITLDPSARPYGSNQLERVEWFREIINECKDILAL